MDNQNPLPMLPDPLEDQPATPALPAPVVSVPTPVQPTVAAVPVAPTKTLPTGRQARRNFWRVGLIAGGAVVILIFILFGSRISELLNLRGTKAGQSVLLDGGNFLDTGSHSVPADSFQVVGGKLMLNNPGS
jgi:hypothetical protein